MEDIFIFSDWEVIFSGVEVQMRAYSTRYTDNGYERIEAMIRFFNSYGRSPELRMKKYDESGELVENLVFTNDKRPYDVFATFDKQVKRMERGEMLEVAE